MGQIKKIFIIQSLKTTDILKSGEELNKKLSVKIPTDFKNLETNIELLEQIDKIKDEITLSKDTYVIHFDCHGNEDGIGLFDSKDNLTFIKWEDLRDKFREIYLATKQKPIISFSSCEGLNVVKLIAEFKPCPYYLITGSFRKIGFQDSVDGYNVFYEYIDSGESADKAMEVTRQGYPKLEFAAFTTERLVEIGWKGYFNTQLTPEKVKERKADIVSQIIAIKGSVSKEEIAFIDRGLSKESAEEDHKRYIKIFFS